MTMNSRSDRQDIAESHYVTFRAMPPTRWRRAFALRSARSPEGLRHILHWLLLGIGLVASTPLGLAQSSTIDTAFTQFWAAKTPAEASQRLAAIIASRVAYDDAFQRLKRGRSYTTQPTGQL